MSYSQKHFRYDSRTLDTQNYISSLQSQLQTTTQALLISQGNSQRINTIQQQLNTAQEKIMNLTRIVKLQQSTQGESAFQDLQRRVTNIQKIKKPNKDFMFEVDQALANAESRMNTLIGKNPAKELNELKKLILQMHEEREKIMRQAAEHAWNAEQTCTKLAQDNLNRIVSTQKIVSEIQELILDSDFIGLEKRVLKNTDRKINQIIDLVNDTIKIQDSLKLQVNTLQTLRQNRHPPRPSLKKSSLKETLPSRSRSSSYSKPEPSKPTKSPSKRDKIVKLYQRLNPH